VRQSATDACSFRTPSLPPIRLLFDLLPRDGRTDAFLRRAGGAGFRRQTAKATIHNGGSRRPVATRRAHSPAWPPRLAQISRATLAVSSMNITTNTANAQAIVRAERPARLEWIALRLAGLCRDGILPLRSERGQMFPRGQRSWMEAAEPANRRKPPHR
jgi:hypothetical protein